MSTIKNLVKDIIVVQLLIVILWTADFQALPSITISCNLLRFMSIESVVLFNHHMLCYPLPFSFCLQYFSASESFPMSQLFASGCQSMGFSFSISPSNEYSGFISFRIDWFDLLAVQGTLTPAGCPGGGETVDRSRLKDSCYLHSPLEWSSTLRPSHLSPRFWTCPTPFYRSLFFSQKSIKPIISQ